MGFPVKRQLIRYILIICFSLFFVSCVDEPQEGESDFPQKLISRGMINASLARYIETGSYEPFEQFSLTGIFAKYSAEENATVDMFFDSSNLETDIALDTCTLPAPVLDEVRAQEPHAENSIELLDVGDLFVHFDGEKQPVSTRTFPDLLRVMDGVIYSADENHGVLFRPGATYEVSASGTPDVSKFRVSLEAPKDLGDVKLNNTTPGEELPVVQRDEDVELTWEGEGYGDELMVTLSWTIMGSPWSITCRVRDDGLFVIPASLTARLPDPLTSSDEEFTIQRTRQVVFRNDDLSSGIFRFVIRTDFPVTF